MRKPQGQSHIVNHLAFSDAAPTIGGASTTFNPSGVAGVSPPRYVQPKQILRTKNVTSAGGMTNKRF